MDEGPAQTPSRASPWRAERAPNRICICSIAIGPTAQERLIAYRGLVLKYLERTPLHEFRKGANFSVPLGNERFKTLVERVLGNVVGNVARGRPVGSTRE